MIPKNKLHDLPYLIVQFFSKATVIKAVWCWCKDRAQCKQRENPCLTSYSSTMKRHPYPTPSSCVGCWPLLSHGFNGLTCSCFITGFVRLARAHVRLRAQSLLSSDSRSLSPASVEVSGLSSKCRLQKCNQEQLSYSLNLSSWQQDYKWGTKIPDKPSEADSCKPFPLA
jgi:hypothetical protein